MDRFSGTNAVDLGGGKMGYRDRNLGAGLVGSIPNALAFNSVQEELLYIITQAGLTPNATNWTQVYTAIIALIAGASRGGNGGSSSTIFTPVASTTYTRTLTFTPAVPGFLQVQSIVNPSGPSGPVLANSVLINGTSLAGDGTSLSMVDIAVQQVTTPGTAITMASRIVTPSTGSFVSIDQLLSFIFVPS